MFFCVSFYCILMSLFTLDWKSSCFFSCLKFCLQTKLLQSSSHLFHNHIKLTKNHNVTTHVRLTWPPDPLFPACMCSSTPINRTGHGEAGIVDAQQQQAFARTQGQILGKRYRPGERTTDSKVPLADTQQWRGQQQGQSHTDREH